MAYCCPSRGAATRFNWPASGRIHSAVEHVKVKKTEQPRKEPRPQDQWLPVSLLGGQRDLMDRWPVLLLVTLTWVLTLPLFAPWSFWPLGFAAFVPWIAAVALSARPGWIYLISYALGAGFYLMHFRWLSETTIEGYLAASLLYLAPLFVPVAWLVRHLHRRRGWSLAIAFPLAWTGQELLHSRGPLAFPWFLLGHSQVRLPSMIQIADLGGVYFVSFVLAAFNGWLADLLLRSLARRRKLPAPNSRWFRLTTGFAVGLVAATVIYGQFRLRQTQLIEGPLVSVIQGDFPMYTVDRPDAPTEDQKRSAYMRLLGQALNDSPDLVVLPETPWTLYLNSEVFMGNPASLPRHWAQRQAFMNLARQRETCIVVGGVSYEPQPPGAYPQAHRYNSAFIFPPDGGEPARYDKIHLVLFGEYVPFRYSLHALYRFLNDGPWNPWGRGGNEYSLTPGSRYAAFGLRPKSQPGQEHHFGITICYEDVIPQVFRRLILDSQGRKQAGLMLNISNDGWFGYGTQQAQHLVSCAFRAIENRVGIARSANTGVSGFIRPDGTWHGLVQQPGRRLHAGGEGHRTARVMLDPRVTLYSRFGDALPAAWSLLTVAGTLDGLVLGLRDWRMNRRSRSGRRKAKK